MSDFNWTDESHDYLRVMWTSGVSQRIGAKRRKKADTSPRRKTIKAPPWRALFATIKHYAPDEIEALPTELPADAIPLTQRKTFAQLKPRHCRFIYGDPSKGDFFYCGAANNFRSVYCAFHYGVTHRPSRSSTAKPERPNQDSIAA